MRGRLTQEQYVRLQEAAKLAIQMEREFNYPPEVFIGQWATESKWGEKKAGQNNVFGMTYVSRHKRFDWVWTREFITYHALQNFTEAERRTASLLDTGLPITAPFQGTRWVKMRRRFASFDAPYDGALDYVLLISRNPLYKKAWEAWTEKKDTGLMIEEIAKAGYATGPEYAKVVKSIARSSEVQAVISTARAAAGR